MGKAEVQRAEIFVHKSRLSEVLDSLQSFGRMHISDVKSLDERLIPLGRPMNEEEVKETLLLLKYVIDALQPYKPIRKDPIENFVELDHSVEIDEKRAEVYTKEALEKAKEVRDDVDRIRMKLSELRTEEERLLQIKRFLRPMENVNVRLEDIGDTEKARILFGTINDPSLLASSDVAYQVVGTKGRKKVVLIGVMKGQDVEEELKKAGFSQITLPEIGYKGTPAEILKNINEREMELKGWRERAEEELRRIADRWLLKLKTAYDSVSIEKQKIDAMKLLGSTISVIVISGWVLREDAEGLRRVLSNSTDGFGFVRITEPDEKDEPPVLLRNPSLLAPFETVTRTFSNPKHDEPDPTPYLAPFFFIFTGLCLTDAGYGLVLAALSAYLRKRYPSMKRFFTLLIFIGISTTIMGALVGGWFGGVLGVLTNGTVSIRPLWFDSMKDPISFLILALALGIFQLLCGVFIRMYHNIRRGAYFDAFADQGLWILLIPSIIIHALSGNVLPGWAAQPTLYISLACIIGLVLTQGRHEKNLFKRLMIGVVSLYGLIGYLSDTLSYSRLLALGMATGVVALIINELAKMTLGIPYVGIIIALLVLVGGHTFNIVINLLGGYIHSSRLQYVEFFGRFFEGGGKRFSPFRKERVYTRIR